MEDILGLMIPIIAILCAVGLPIGLGMYIAIRAVNTRHRERMEIIKQGIIPENIKPAPNRYRSLRNGVLCVGLGLGLTIGFIIMQLVDCGFQEKIIILASATLLCLGVSYIVFYLLTGNKKEELDDTY